MRYCFHFDPSHCRNWIRLLIERLAEDGQGEFFSSQAEAVPHPPHIEKLLNSETGRLFAGKSHLASPMDAALLAQMAPLAKADQDYDLVIDLVGDGSAPNGKASVTLLFNGFASERALITSIMQSGIPQIALRDQDGQIVATAEPSPELAKGVSGAMEQTYARVITLLLAWSRNPARWVAPLRGQKAEWKSAGQVAGQAAKERIKSALKQIYYRLFLPSHWRIGWRWVADGADGEGGDVWSTRSLAGLSWQVLADHDNHFYADPVPWHKDGVHYLFFEDFDPRSQKGILSVLTLDEKGPTGPARPCLEEPFHLSYPFLIEHEGEVYMVPETSAKRSVTFYKAENFPFGWKPYKTILTDIDAADVTITRHQGRWWLFCVTRDGGGGYSDCLSIFYADDLFGPWHAHGQNPVLIDKATARPAGNFVHMDGRLCRPVQDCSLSYGCQLQLVEVTHLSPEHYEQKTLAILAPNERWPGRKLHTLNRAGWLEVIDGAILRPRLAFFKKLADRIFRPAA
ncbi:hypothetical protein [uncultured Cohaesibacter sp.]|uniref:glucosamine inositolphosphorylceramide transferase family protein n=1 Tax=uncultured Cohaesibacter sp. TaxID=1002546 RepID=UPI0029C76107|nr:hypothetical protein [uncultured Cohaesibacter sp.]